MTRSPSRVLDIDPHPNTDETQSQLWAPLRRLVNHSQLRSHSVAATGHQRLSDEAVTTVSGFSTDKATTRVYHAAWEPLVVIGRQLEPSACRVVVRSRVRIPTEVLRQCQTRHPMRLPVRQWHPATDDAAGIHMHHARSRYARASAYLTTNGEQLHDYARHALTGVSTQLPPVVVIGSAYPHRDTADQTPAGSQQLPMTRLVSRSRCTVASNCAPSVNGSGPTKTRSAVSGRTVHRYTSQRHPKDSRRHRGHADGSHSICIPVTSRERSLSRCPTRILDQSRAVIGSLPLPAADDESPQVLTDGGTPEDDSDQTSTTTTDHKTGSFAVYGPCPACNGLITSHPIECDDCGFEPIIHDGGWRQDTATTTGQRQLTSADTEPEEPDTPPAGSIVAADDAPPLAQSHLFDSNIAPTGRQAPPAVTAFQLTSTVLPDQFSALEADASVTYELDGTVARPIATSLPGNPRRQLTRASVQRTAVIALLDTYAGMHSFVQDVAGLRPRLLRVDPTTNWRVPSGHETVTTPASTPHAAHTALHQALANDVTTETRRRAIQRALAQLGTGDYRTAIAFCHVWAAAKQEVDQQRCVALLKPARRALGMFSVTPTGGERP